MQLYSIFFTTKQTIKKYDSRGKNIDTYTVNVDRAIHALPLELTKPYEGYTNFRREPFEKTDMKTNKDEEPFEMLAFKPLSQKKRAKRKADDSMKAAQ